MQFERCYSQVVPSECRIKRREREREIRQFLPFASNIRAPRFGGNFTYRSPIYRSLSGFTAVIWLSRLARHPPFAIPNSAVPSTISTAHFVRRSYGILCDIADLAIRPTYSEPRAKLGRLSLFRLVTPRNWRIVRRNVYRVGSSLGILRIDNKE